MPDEIERLSSRLVYENPWMRMREDAIRRADGSDGIYGVMEKPDYAVVAAVEDGVIHMVEQFRYPIGQRSLELPQGALNETPDAAPIEVARAELREETGITAGAWVAAGRLYEASGHATQAYTVWLASDLTHGEAERSIEEQGMIVRALPIVDVERRIVDGEITDASTVASFGLLRMRGML